MTLTRQDTLAHDAADPLAAFRARFKMPAGKIYLGGNTLGAASHDSLARLVAAGEAEWAANLVSAWNLDDWIGLPRRVGAKIALLIGAADGEVVVTDSTSINLYKLLASARRMRPDRPVILTDRENFPTDLYIIDAVAAQTGCHVEHAPAADLTGAIERLGQDLAVVLATEVDYVSGARGDIAVVNRAAHAVGGLTLWDLSHSVGIVPVDLTATQTDFAVGCTYKYLNGGPGAPAFLYVAKRHQAEAPAVLPGWMGHARPFDFAPVYAPADGIVRHQVGTPPILSMSALEPAVDVAIEAGIAAIREKSAALTALMIELVERDCTDLGVSVMTPREPPRRGGHVALSHQEGYAVMQALIAQGVVGDFRPPATMRFGLHPLYVSYADVWDAVAALREIVAERRYEAPEFREKKAVT